MASPLPPDPYKILGVEKDATLPQIRLAHRKLVLQCHPDKVQDPKLKAIKVDEFQKVQEAYEILSDVSRRSEYDQKVKLQKLREELGKTSTSTSTPAATTTPASSSKTYEYNVRTAEPRPTTYSSSYPKTPQKTPKEPNVYSKPPPRSYEDLYDEPARPSVRRSKTTTRDSERDERDRRRHQEEDDREKLRRKMDKEAKREHADRKKPHDKEKRRADEKVRPNTYVEEESSGDDYRRKAERTRRAEDAMRAEVAARAQQEREARDREHREWEHRERERERELRDRERERKERDRDPPTVKDSPMGEKWKDHMANAARYVQASRRESEVKPEVPFAPAPPAKPTMRRADTFAATPSAPYNVRYEVRPSATYENHSDDETPRRSTAARPSRRSVETPSKSKDTPKSTRRSTRESPYVNTASTSPPTHPTLHKQYSEPPIVGVGSGRREPSRSKTTEYPREPPQPPPFSRAATFTQGTGMKEDMRDRGRGPSRIIPEPVSESDSGSDSESPSPTPQYSHRQPRREAPESNGTTKTYVINNNGRSELKNSSYRSDLRDDAYTKGNRNPSDSRAHPPLTRNSGSASRPVRSQSRGYHPAPEPAEPIVLTAQPKSREPSRGASRGNYPPQYSVNYAAPIGPENIVYSTGTQYVDRRNTESGHHRDYPPYPTTRGREGIYT